LKKYGNSKSFRISNANGQMEKKFEASELNFTESKVVHYLSYAM